MYRGGYVHLKAADIDIESLSERLGRQRNKIEKKINSASAPSQTSLKKLADQINITKQFLTSNVDGNAGTARTVLMESVKALLKDTLDSIDFSTGTISTSGHQGIGKIRVRDYSDIDTVRRRLTNLYNVAANGQGSGFDFRNEKQAYKSLKTIADAAAEQIKNMSEGVQKLFQKYYPNNRFTDNIVQQLKELTNKNSTAKNVGKDLRILLNTCISILAPTKALLLAQGTLFEQILAISTATLENYSEDQIRQLIQQNVKGAQRASVVWDKNKFNKNVSKRLFASGGNNGVQWEVSGTPTQGKVDVILSVQGDGNVPEELRISAKSISFSHGGSAWIHVVSDTSLLTILSQENASVIADYAEIFAKHEDDTADLNGLRQSYFQYAQLLAAMRAVAGDVLRVDSEGNPVNDSANVLVVNDVLTGEIRIISIKQVWQNLFDAVKNATEGHTGGAISMKYNGQSVSGQGYKVALLENNFVEGSPKDAPWDRVAKVYSQIHAAKISVAINSSKIFRLDK